MLIQKQGNGLRVDTKVFNQLQGDLLNINKIIITVTINNCPTIYKEEYEGLEILTTPDIAEVGTEGFLLLPSFIQEDILLDGIYTIKVELITTNNEYISETSCSFVDVNIKCLLSSTMEKLLSDDKDLAMLLHATHYALTNASNCGCNCEELNNLYEFIYRHLKEDDNDKGCNCTKN